jgi:plastocyanin
MRRIVLAAIAATLTFAVLSATSLAGGGHCVNDARPTEGADPNVKIANCSFQAAVLRVPVGTRVTWTNADTYLPHIVSGIGWGKPQTMLMSGDTFSQDFTEAGIYPYTCPLHPGMSAVVIVGDVAAPAAQSSSVASRAEPAAQRGPDGSGLAIALVASLLVGVTSFLVGRSFR